MTLEYLISHFGYAALFVGVFFEGETILILAGMAAHLGRLSLIWVIVVAFLGSLGGDQFYFYLGRAKGRRFLGRRSGWTRKIEKVGVLFERYQTLVILGFRFMYGLRTVTPFAFGLGRVSAIRFLFFNAIGAALWSVAVAFLGYLFGAVAQAVLADVKKYEHWMIFGVLCAGAVAWSIYFLHNRSRERGRR